MKASSGLCPILVAVLACRCWSRWLSSLPGTCAHGVWSLWETHGQVHVTWEDADTAAHGAQASARVDGMQGVSGGSRWGGAALAAISAPILLLQDMAEPRHRAGSKDHAVRLAGWSAAESRPKRRKWQEDARLG